jgi:hypothetical protein
VVTTSSSDTEEALELLSLSSGCGVSSQPSGGDAQEPSSSSGVGSDLFEDWLEANDMDASVYVVLTAMPLSSRAPTASAPHSEQKSHARSSSSQRPRSQTAALWRFHHQKPEDIEAPRKK